ncbi:MAG: hypothetical protein E7311_03145 [Clostridiales bacterium]|nr:hypothetical protein [Clostridiales bacterium]
MLRNILSPILFILGVIVFILLIIYNKKIKNVETVNPKLLFNVNIISGCIATAFILFSYLIIA